MSLINENDNLNTFLKIDITKVFQILVILKIILIDILNNLNLVSMH